MTRTYSQAFVFYHVEANRHLGSTLCDPSTGYLNEAESLTRRSCKAEMDAGAFRFSGEVPQRRACSGSHPAPAQPPLLGRRLCRAAACNTYMHTGRRSLRAASLLPGICSCNLETRACAIGGGIVFCDTAGSKAVGIFFTGVQLLQRKQRRRPTPHQVINQSTLSSVMQASV